MMMEKLSLFEKLAQFFAGPAIANHPFFGKLVFTGEGYEGSKYFIPIDQKLELYIHTEGDEEISNSQMDFFLSFEDRYISFTNSITDAIEQEVNSQYIKGYSIIDFASTFDLVYLQIPKLLLLITHGR